MTPEQRAGIEARQQAAWDEVTDLCSGKHRWTMRVPAEEDRDSDLVIGNALRDIHALLAALAEAEQLLAESVVREDALREERDAAEQREAALANAVGPYRARLLDHEASTRDRALAWEDVTDALRAARGPRP